MDEEMRAHLERATERFMARGARWAESVVTDVRLALRGLRRTPLFAAVAVLSIGIGVGATTAIVTIANVLLLQSPPGVTRADRVVSIGATRHGKGFDTFSYATYSDYARASTLSSLAALDIAPRALSLVDHDNGQAVNGG